MKHYKYTNKNELPIPKYNEGQKLWMLSCLCIDSYSVTQTIIRKVLPPRWIDYEDTPHWDVEYRHQPEWNVRMVQCPIDEESLFDTEEEALRVAFENFREDTFKKLESFKKRFEALGVKCPNTKPIE